MVCNYKSTITGNTFPTTTSSTNSNTTSPSTLTTFDRNSTTPGGRRRTQEARDFHGVHDTPRPIDDHHVGKLRKKSARLYSANIGKNLLEYSPRSLLLTGEICDSYDTDVERQYPTSSTLQPTSSIDAPGTGFDPTRGSPTKWRSCFGIAEELMALTFVATYISYSTRMIFPSYTSRRQKWRITHPFSKNLTTMILFK